MWSRVRSAQIDWKVDQLHSRANSLVAKFKEGGVSKYLDEAIVLDRKALELCQPGHPKRHVSLNQLGLHLSDRYDQLGAMTDLEAAITLGRDTLALRTAEHLDRSMALNNLSVYLSIRYEQLGAMEDLNEAIILARDALALHPPGHPERVTSLKHLAIRLSIRYDQLGAMEDLNEAIVLGRDALALSPPEHPNRSTSLNNLAGHLSDRYKQLGAMNDLNEAIFFGRDALALRPPGHPGRVVSLKNLAINLSARYDRLGALEDLSEAIVLARDTLALCTGRHPDRFMALNNLSVYLSNLYKQLGNMEDLNEAIVLNRDALAVCPPGHPDHSTSLNTLGVHLSSRYNQLGTMEDLDEAIVFGRGALALCPPGHPNHSTSSNNLAGRLSARYRQLGAMEDLNEAIVLARDALAHRPPVHPYWPDLSSNLAGYLSDRYKQLGAMEDLDEAIVLSRDTLAVCPPGYPARSRYLNNLAVHLFARYNQLGTMDDFNEAIALDRDALALRPPRRREHSMALNNLAVRLSTRYNQLGEMEDLNEAIVLARDALELLPLEHPDRSSALNNLAGFLRTRIAAPSQFKDEEELFSLYSQLAHPPSMVSSTDLSAARTWIRVAEDFHHSTTLLAYQTYLRLLTHHVATLPPLRQHRTVLKGITSSLAVDSFSACLRNQSPTHAIELLEQGRGVFWGQLTRLRSPLDSVIASSPTGEMLADEFTQLTSLIRIALDSPGADQHDRVCHLNVEFQSLVTRIRELPGLSRFLLPPLFSDLQQAAREGPVIIVNASEYSCDALIVLADRNPHHIPLSITKDGVRALSSKLSTLSVRTLSMDVTEDLVTILRELWDKVVSPIVNFLQTVLVLPLRSRIWWCPTAELSLLPLHAAGPHKEGQQNLANLYISSYTPTLTALIRSRRHNPASKGGHFLGIGQANAEGENEIVSVGAELANIGQRVDGLTTFTQIEGHDSCIARVGEELGKNEWVHLACHGIPNPEQPFESAFALRDGHFTIEHIIQRDLQNAQFAFLSACQTTVGDEESADEVIHLASAMQFAGFRSVIGTMWAVMDVVAPMVTSAFYDNMIDECGCLDYTRAALALNKTIEELVDIPFDQRFLYIHIGA